MVAPEEASPSKGKVFAQRLGSTSFLYGVLMIGLFSSSRQLSLIAFGGIITLLGVLALMELYGMAEKRGLKPFRGCLLYTSPSPRDRQKTRMPSSA